MNILNILLIKLQLRIIQLWLVLFYNNRWIRTKIIHRYNFKIYLYYMFGRDLYMTHNGYSNYNGPLLINSFGFFIHAYKGRLWQFEEKHYKENEEETVTLYNHQDNTIYTYFNNKLTIGYVVNFNYRKGE